MLLAVLAAGAAAGAAAADPFELLVTTKTGKLQGLVEDGSRKWLGVPYAEPPIGPRRWSPPVPKKPWGEAPRPATFNTPDCAQFGPGWPSLGMTGLNFTSEDCLTLNIFAPPTTPAGGAPVVVYFPAGAYTWGAANDAENNGYGASRAPGWQSTIFVAANYRTGIFGFLGHGSLRARDPSGSTGCYGAQDQREALRWVKANIAAFGGDPERVTIFGESAGATSITTHMVMEKSWGLFHRAAADSGGFSDWVRAFDDAADVFENVSRTLGCAGASDPVACLVAKPTGALLNVSDPFYGNGSLPHPESVLGTQWAPVVDGVELKAKPQALLAEGRVAPGVPMLLGSNKDEGSLFRQQGVGDYIGSEFMFHNWLNDSFVRLAKVLVVAACLAAEPSCFGGAARARRWRTRSARRASTRPRRPPPTTWATNPCGPCCSPTCSATSRCTAPRAAPRPRSAAPAPAPAPSSTASSTRPT